MLVEAHARYTGWRVYKHIVQKLAADDGAPLRLMIQASAGIIPPAHIREYRPYSGRFLI